MTPLRHQMIRASAGSGKTYQLTERVLQLLEHGAEPDRIVALTFTRKAAGEFFDEVLAKLAQRAEQAPERYLPLLRRLIDAMPRLRLGTLDGFFAKVVRGFPFELGLTGDFELLQEHAARRERRRVLRRMFTRAQGGLEAAQREFIEAFKRATFGVEEKRLGARLDQFLDAHHDVFLAASGEALWGNHGRIWPEGARWLRAPEDMTGPLRVLREWSRSGLIEEKQRGRWRAFCDAVEQWRPGGTAPRELIYVLEKALEVLPELEAGAYTLKFDKREQRLSAEAARALAELALALVAAEFARRVAITQGIRTLLAGYETFYHEAVRRGGRLTFADIQRLLQPVKLESGEDAEAEAGRLALDYRLDGGVDHWLLDEFQDTSFGQWSILENLIGEVMQDAGGQRTFFCVGDVKQAIYAWREGDHRLFEDILERYNAEGSAIEERDLDESQRSVPAIMELVNQVFGDRAVITELFSGPASDEWNRAWHPHSSAERLREIPGQAAALVADDEQGRWETVKELLMEIDPVERGMTCAVLVQKNETAAEVAEMLRRDGGLPAVAESDLHVCVDHPTGAALLALVQVAAHPADGFAWQHVQMTPLAAVLRERGWVQQDDVARGLTAEIQRDGYGRTLARLLAALEGRMEGDSRFNRERADQVIGAAAAFDETGARSAADFIEFMERFTVRPAESAGVIRVMTVHKAKGLGFDLVVVPDLEGQRLAQRRDGLAVQRAKNRQVEWILDLPAKDFWQGDPVIEAHVAAQEAAGCYEKLALLYVALTRAKRGLYVITEPVGKSASRNYPKLISETLGDTETNVTVGARSFRGVWSAGDPSWFAAPGETDDRTPADPPLAVTAAAAPPPSRAARRPSGHAGGLMPAARLFSLDAADAADFGVAVHALLAQVEWANAEERARVTERWRRGGNTVTASTEAAATAAACLLAPALAPLWEKPPGRAEVWRERAFELVDGDAWVSGKFDRVVLRRADDGSAVTAVIYDFKTDAVTAGNAEDRYAEQMEWYRKAVQRLSGLPDEQIRTEVIWVKRFVGR